MRELGSKGYFLLVPICMGFSGHGFKFFSAVGEALKDLALGNPTKWICRLSLYDGLFEYRNCLHMERNPVTVMAIPSF